MQKSKIFKLLIGLITMVIVSVSIVGCNTNQKKMSSEPIQTSEPKHTTSPDGKIDENTVYKYSGIIERLAKTLLVSPSSAKFPDRIFTDDWVGTRSGGIITISSYVDSENNYGAMVRNRFTVKIRESDDDIISYVFDGKEMVK